MELLRTIMVLAVILMVSIMSLDGADAATPKTPVPAASMHFLDKEASEACSEPSIAISKKWRKERGAEAQQAKNSMLADPQTRILATLLFFEANKGYEDLVLNCAIWRRLGGGAL